MTDILKGFVGGTFAYALAWILPGVALVILIALFPYPVWIQLGVPDFVHGYDAVTRLLGFAVIAVFIGVLGATARTPFYRLLEGYFLPSRLYTLAQKRKVARRNRLRKEWESAPQRSLRAALAYERYARYPDVDDEVAPTDLGNAMRVVEIYGRLRFGLDSQTFWTELYSVTPDPIRREVDSAQAGVDFCVAILYASLTFALIATLTFLEALFHLPRAPGALLVFGVVGLLLTLLWYRLAVWGCSYYLATVQAMVNLGRTALASNLGLQLPERLEDERVLWEAMADVVNGDNDPAKFAIIDARRVRAGKRDGAPAWQAVTRRFARKKNRARGSDSEEIASQGSRRVL